MLYPLVLQPLFKSQLWGGRALERLYRKPLPPDVPIGESWEITDRPESVSVIANGPLAGNDLRWLMDQHAAALLGRAPACRGRFPLLVKLIDAQHALSVQVHPPPEVAARLGGEPKTEVWYVADAAPDAVLYVGLRKGVTRSQFERAIPEGNVIECLHPVRVRAGDAMFVPSGRVHTIGAGCVILEIQQNSDTTYRVFDWNRVGPDGKQRLLHVDQAMASINFDDLEPSLVPAPPMTQHGWRVRQLADDPLFAIWEYRVSRGARDHRLTLDRPAIVAVVAGSLQVSHAPSGVTVQLQPGRFCLVPASASGAVMSAADATTYLVAQPGGEQASPR